MSLPRFFLDQQVLAEQKNESFVLELSDEDAKHLRVLRLSPGEHLAVIDASLDYFECEIQGFEGRLPLVRIAQHKEADSSRPQLSLIQGLAKGDKIDKVIRHTTELGVSRFIPLACKRSVLKLDAKRALAKQQRWQAIAKSAAMQSGQPAIPRVEQACSVRQLLDELSTYTALLICWEQAPQTAGLAEALSAAFAERGISDAKDAQIALVVGPEGGLCPDEVEALLNSNEQASLIRLGPSILRTETAGIVASALVLYELGALGPR